MKFVLRPLSCDFAAKQRPGMFEKVVSHYVGAAVAVVLAMRPTEEPARDESENENEVVADPTRSEKPISGVPLIAMAVWNWGALFFVCLLLISAASGGVQSWKEAKFDVHRAKKVAADFLSKRILLLASYQADGQCLWSENMHHLTIN